MNNKLDPETLKIPAYMRKKMIVSQSRQKLILTALDRKQAKLPHNSTVAVAPFKRPVLARPVNTKTARPKSFLSKTPRTAVRPYAPTACMQAPEIHDTGQTSLFDSGKSFQQIGQITHFLDKISVAIVMLSAPLKRGDILIIEGDGELFMQEVQEMQIDRNPVTKAKKGAHIGLKVNSAARVEGNVYRFS